MKHRPFYMICAIWLSIGEVTPLYAQQPPLSGAGAVADVRRLASGSQCAAHEWGHHRGIAPRSYIEGVALVFARAVCQPQRDDVQIVSAPAVHSSHNDDALSVYQEQFQTLGMKNNRSGIDTLRHSYTLLIGLGMMESSGRYCEGRDVSQCFTQADSAEAGLFQTSFGASVYSSPVLKNMFKSYQSNARSCFLEIFRGSVTCSIRHSHNQSCPSVTSEIAGAGEGASWQQLTKSCPAFATEYGAVLIRKHGGLRGEFNPIRKQEVDLRPECDSMLEKVQDYVQSHRNLCSDLR